VAREQRKLAAIVAADVVGYSRLMGRDESGTMAALGPIRLQEAVIAAQEPFPRPHDSAAAIQADNME